MEEERRYEEKYVNVFQDWKVDTEETHKIMLENDFKYWKIPKFVKDTQQVFRIQELIHKHLPRLKEIYISLISSSGYPNITWLDFANFIQQIDIIDDKLPLATIDRLFISTNLEDQDIAENPDRSLCRFEFFEILVRIAANKYKEL